jgi:hypothetical protein
MSKTKKRNYKKNTKKYRKSRKKMRGGEFSQEDEETLRGLQFNDDEIEHFNQLNIPINIINQAVQYYHDNSHQIISNIAQQLNGNAGNNIHDEDHNEGNNDSNVSSLLHDSDLAVDDNEIVNNNDDIAAIPHNANDIHDLDLNESGNTTFADDSFGGKRYSNKRKTKK